MDRDNVNWIPRLKEKSNAIMLEINQPGMDSELRWPRSSPLVQEDGHTR